MSAKTDQVKGRIKEAVGALTDNKDLRKEGRADQKAGKEKLVAKAKKDVAEAEKDVAESKKELEDAEDASTSCNTGCD